MARPKRTVVRLIGKSAYVPFKKFLLVVQSPFTLAKSNSVFIHSLIIMVSLFFSETMALISTVLAIICIFSLSVTEAQKCSNASYSLRNTKLLHNIIKTESNVNDFSTCLDKCSTHGSCHSINFNINKAICELNSANHLSNPEHVTYSYSTVYMGYSLRPVGRCSDAYCRKEDQECAMDKDGASYKCVAKQCEGKERVTCVLRRRVGHDT